MSDKYSAVWVSHSSISDFLECPRAYFLKNMFKRPETGHKITLMSPPLALGQIVHEVLEPLSSLPHEMRFNEPLIAKFEKAWEKVRGEKGGFSDASTEKRYHDRGKMMIERVMHHKSFLTELAVKIKTKEGFDLPNFMLSEEDNIILCGKIDWLKYDKENDTVFIIDFKTSRNEEGLESLQLPIYHLLASYCQSHLVSGAAYWYLNMSDELTNKKLPELEKSKEKVLKIAKKIKLARSIRKFDCASGPFGCRACLPLEKVFRGEAKFVGVDNMRRDIFIAPKKEEAQLKDESVIL